MSCSKEKVNNLELFAQKEAESANYTPTVHQKAAILVFVEFRDGHQTIHAA